MFRFFSFLGDRARYPLKLRPEGLVTASIVVAVLRTRKTHSTSMNAFSTFINPVNTALRDGGRIQIIKGINSGNFSRLHIYNIVCHKRPKAACAGCFAPKTSIFRESTSVYKRRFGQRWTAFHIGKTTVYKRR